MPHSAPSVLQFLAPQGSSVSMSTPWTGPLHPSKADVLTLLHPSKADTVNPLYPPKADALTLLHPSKADALTLMHSSRTDTLTPLHTQERNFFSTSPGSPHIRYESPRHCPQRYLHVTQPVCLESEQQERCGNVRALK